MKITKIEYPEIPDKGFMSDWAARILAAGDEKLEEILKRELNKTHVWNF